MYTVFTYVTVFLKFKQAVVALVVNIVFNLRRVLRVIGLSHDIINQEWELTKKVILQIEGHDELIEPLNTLFKDEVRELGEKLGMPHELVWRQPFPSKVC